LHAITSTSVLGPAANEEGRDYALHSG